jgi:hypothetical protein
MDQANNLQRLAGQFCEPRHRVRKTFSMKECFVCKKKKLCQIACDECKAFFCIGCRPPKLKGEDYCGH